MLPQTQRRLVVVVSGAFAASAAIALAAQSAVAGKPVAAEPLSHIQTLDLRVAAFDPTNHRVVYATSAGPFVVQGCHGSQDSSTYNWAIDRTPDHAQHAHHAVRRERPIAQRVITPDRRRSIPETRSARRHRA